MSQRIKNSDGQPLTQHNEDYDVKLERNLDDITPVTEFSLLDPWAWALENS